MEQQQQQQQHHHHHHHYQAQHHYGMTHTHNRWQPQEASALQNSIDVKMYLVPGTWYGFIIYKIILIVLVRTSMIQQQYKSSAMFSNEYAAGGVYEKV